jgi:hypothetical protein
MRSHRVLWRSSSNAKLSWKWDNNLQDEGSRLSSAPLLLASAPQNRREREEKAIKRTGSNVVEKWSNPIARLLCTSMNKLHNHKRPCEARRPLLRPRDQC